MHKCRIKIKIAQHRQEKEVHRHGGNQTLRNRHQLQEFHLRHVGQNSGLEPSAREDC